MTETPNTSNPFEKMKDELRRSDTTQGQADSGDAPMRAYFEHRIEYLPGASELLLSIRLLSSLDGPQLDNELSGNNACLLALFLNLANPMTCSRRWPKLWLDITCAPHRPGAALLRLL